jgi:hypothetical protein
MITDIGVPTWPPVKAKDGRVLIHWRVYIRWTNRTGQLAVGSVSLDPMKFDESGLVEVSSVSIQFLLSNCYSMYGDAVCPAD